MPAPAHLRFFHGPMDCGKSTLALQVDHNQSRQGRSGLLLTQGDRSARPRISSRVGWCRPAVEVDAGADLRLLVRAHRGQGRRVDYLIVDEAQFLTEAQVEVLVRGTGAAQRPRGGRRDVRRRGATVVVADTAPTPAPDEPSRDGGPAAGGRDVHYQVLCRRHHRLGQLGPTAAGPGQLALP